MRIQNAPNVVSSFGFDLSFDTDVLTYTGFDKGTLVNDFDYFDVNSISDGLLRCGGFDSDGNIVQDATDDVVYLNFAITDTVSNKSELTLSGPEDDIVNWSASAGCFFPGCTGDVNLDGRITPQDALCAFEAYMGICPTSCNIECGDICGDVNYDDEITPADALCIFEKYLQKPGCLDE